MTEKGAGQEIARSRLGSLARAVWPYLAATLLVVLTVAAAQAFSAVAWIPHVSVLFFACVLAAAVPWGVGPSLLAVALAVAASAYYFFPPIHSFLVDHPQDLVDLCAFAVVAVLLSHLTARIRRQAKEARAREALMADIYTFSRRIAGIIDRDELCREILGGLRRVIGEPMALFVPEEGGRIRFVQNPDVPAVPGAATLSAAEKMLKTPSPRPLAITDSGTLWRLHPLKGGGRVVAVLAIGDPRSPELSPVTVEVLDRTALAIERSDLAKAVENVKVRARTDELREALVNSVSHDLKTPLTSIIGSATALKEFWRLHDETARIDLVATIYEEAMRLDHVVGNALELARFRSGEMKPRREATEVSDIVNAAVADAQRTAPGRTINVDLPGDLPMLDLDPFLAERALVQILENAAKYSPAGTPIAVVARETAGKVAVEVSDDGVGFAPEEASYVFERFYRAAGDEAQIAGTGLGLAIARAFVEANGGTIEAVSPGRGRGATFKIAYPVPVGTSDGGAA